LKKIKSNYEELGIDKDEDEVNYRMFRDDHR